jgi:hypothetical protein
VPILTNSKIKGNTSRNYIKAKYESIDQLVEFVVMKLVYLGLNP